MRLTPPVEILEAIHDVHNGGSPMSSTIARKVVQHFRHQTCADAQRLSKREHEILGHLTKGYQNKQIAEMLGLSVETVCCHLRSIYDKFQVNSRTEAVLKYLGR